MWELNERRKTDAQNPMIKSDQSDQMKGEGAFFGLTVW